MTDYGSECIFCITKTNTFHFPVPVSNKLSLQIFPKFTVTKYVQISVYSHWAPAITKTLVEYLGTGVVNFLEVRCKHVYGGVNL
jgi:hypothetical protein